MKIIGDKISNIDAYSILDAYNNNSVLLLTVPNVGNYILPFTELYNTFDSYVKLKSDSKQIINSALDIVHNSENSSFYSKGTYITIGDVYDTSGLSVCYDDTNYIMLTKTNEKGTQGPTLFIGDRNTSYSRYNQNGMHYKSVDGIGLDSLQYATNGTNTGQMIQQLKPDANTFYWSLEFPDILMTVRSNVFGGDLYMNSPLSNASMRILVHSNMDNPQMYLRNLPLKTNTGIYSGSYMYGIEFNDVDKLKFVRGADNEIGSIFQYDTINSYSEFMLGDLSDQSRVYLMQPNASYSMPSTVLWADCDRTALNYGDVDVRVATDGFFNNSINGTASTTLRWNYSGINDNTAPSSLNSWLRNELKLGTYSTFSELRNYNNATQCYSELQLESSRSNNTVTLRAGYSGNDSRIDINGTSTRFSVIDSSQLLTYTSKTTTNHYFMVDLQYNQMNISGLEVYSSNGTTFRSPVLTETPTAPTVTNSTDSTTKIATTAFVQNKISKPSGTVTEITTTGSITPTDGKIYKIVGTGITVTLSVSGSGVCFIQNDTTVGNANIIVFPDVSGINTQIILSTTADNIQTASFSKTTSGYMKI